MGRRLSILCSCLPSRQRDNLSSRALYSDQDSSGHEDCYSDNDDNDDDDDQHRHYPFRYPRALSYFQKQSQVEDHRQRSNDDQNGNDNPWPTNFPNGRFSQQANQSLDGTGGGSRNYTQRPNPFRTLGNNKDGEEDLDYNGEGRVGERMTSFEPFRDDHEGYDDDEDECDDENQKLLKGHHRSKILPKMDYTPFRIKTDDTRSSLQEEVRAPTSVSLSSQPQSRPKPRPPRNPQGRMIWQDDDDGIADAEDILDVDALIAEQERITQELSKQEDALRKEEEAAIVTKRVAAIRAAERRGLLRFEGDQLVIPGSNSSSDNINNINNSNHVNHGHEGHGNRNRVIVQDDGDWNYSRRIQDLQLQQEQQEQGRDNEGNATHTMDGSMSTSSAASSFVGGIDVFNQELKMMNLTMESNRHRKESNQITAITTSSTTTPAISQKRPRAVSTSVSTSAASTSSNVPSLTLPSPGTMISPRGVFNSVASFLKKVDCVIAGDSGDSSSDEAASERTDQQRQKPPSRQQIQENGPQGLADQRIEQGDRSNSAGPDTGTGTGAEAHGTGESSQETKKNLSSTMAIQFETEERPHPEDPLNTVATESIKSSLTPNKRLELKLEAPPAPATAIDPAASGGGMLAGTFSSLFSTGVSLIGYFGGGGVSQHYDSDEEYHTGGNQQLSTLKYGDSKKQHHVNTRRKAAVEDDDDDDGIDDYNF